MTLQAFLSRRVVTPEAIGPGAILVDGEHIQAVVSPEQVPAGAETHDFGEAAILPGLVDSHVHINEPGTDRLGGIRDWHARGGCGRVHDAGGHAAELPAGDDDRGGARSEARGGARASAESIGRAWGGVVADNQRDIEALAAAGVLGFKCFLIHPGIDGFTMVTEPELRAALPHVARTGLPLLVHAELGGPVDAATEALEFDGKVKTRASGVKTPDEARVSMSELKLRPPEMPTSGGADWRLYATYLKSRPDEAELAAIRLLLSLCREYRFRLHNVHLSTSEGLSLLRAARDEGLPVSVETCPHYLHLAAETIADGATLCKCAPPIRSRENREKLWQGLRDGTIDLVATDHSPCPPSMKKLEEGNFKTAWGGIASLSMALPVMWTGASARGFTLSDIARWMAEGPARLAGCHARKGRIAAGCDADFVVFEPEAEFVVTKERLHQRHAVSPYLGENLRGVVKATYLRGKLVFADGEFPGEPSGKEFRL